MAGDTNSNIFINIDTSQAMTQLRLLEKELTTLNRSLIVGTKTAAAAQSKYAQSLLHNVNATGQWTASMTRMSTASEQFANRLDKQKLSLKEYFRYGAASTKTFGKMFGSEFDTLGKLVDKRVKTLQQQYVQLGRDAQGAMNAMKFTPKALNYNNLTTQLMAASQRHQIFNKLIDDGSTKLLNFGKNTQWAGRQLMVGFTIPLMLFGSQAIKTFKEIETQVIRFKKVYGDIFTDQGATAAALKNIRDLADEYTKYGLKVSDTIKMAADAAAAGFSGQGLQTLVEQTNKLAVLGGVTQEKALETTIALKNAFQIDTGAMSGTIDFLNAVENQTVVALDDLTEAIPKVAPVIQQLGGDVKDLAYFMAAMQEGGISAAQGANALKSGLASLINPSNAASKAAAAVGINIKGIVEANAGNLRNTVTSFAKALQPLTDLERSRVIEKVFGKYQFARISALLNNIGREGTQAARVLQLTNASVEELAILSQRELKIQADSPMNKFVGSVERLKAAIAPIGELFAKVLTPALEFISRMADKFNSLPDGIKKAIGIITVVVGGLGPLFLMTFGLLANAVANSVKGLQVLRKGYQQLAYGSSDAALKTQYLSQEELENISISNALYSKHQQLSAAYQLEAAALTSLTNVYRGASVAMGGFAGQNPGLFIPGKGGMPRRFASGTTSVPGPKGAGDVVPSMLSPGEAIIPAKQSQKYSGFISQIIKDKVPGFAGGLFPSFGAAATVGKGIPLSSGPAAFREAQQARYAARDAARRGLSGNVAPVVPISSRLSGIKYSAEGSKVRVSVGDESFLIPASKLDNFKSKLKENEAWMIANKRTDNTEQELLRTIKRKGYGGKEVSPSTIYSRLPKFSNARNSQQNQDIADKRFKALLKSKNPHLLKLQNYLVNEEKVYLEKVLGQDVVKSLKGWDVNKLTPSHIREVRSQNRTPEDWAPSKIARDWGWFNSGLRGTKFANIKGGHPLNAAQARELLTNLEKTPFDKLPNEKKALQAALEYRLNRKPSYYDDFTFTDNAMMKVKPMNLASGIVSVPGPKGAGDIQPAMLSPGESVIPAKQSAKYMPLIQSMVADKVPGYENSNVNPFSGTPAPAGMVYTPSGLLVPAGGGQASAASRSPDRVERAIDKFFDKPRVKKLGDRIDNFSAKVKTATPKIADLGSTAGSAADSAARNAQVASTMTKEELKNARQLKQMNGAGKSMGIGMAASMLPMMGMAQASSNPNGMMARNMSTLSSVAMLAMIAPMLNTPVKLLASVAIGYAVILKMQSQQIKKAIIEGDKLSQQFAMTSTKLEEFGKITGNVSVTQIEEQKRLGRTSVAPAASQQFGENFLGSETGKKFKEDFDKLSKQYESSVAGQISVAQLASAVNQGVLSYLQAESVITKMARDLKDPNLEFQMQGQLMKILGPDGQDLSKNPLKVQLELIKANQTGFDAVAKNFQEVGSSQLGMYSKGEFAGLAGGTVAGGIVGLKAYNLSLAAIATEAGAATTNLSLMGQSIKAIGPGRITAVAAVLGTIATRVFQRGKEAEAIGAAAGTLQGVASQNFAAIQQSADALSNQYSIQIGNLSLEKDRTTNLQEIERITSRITTLEASRTAGLDALAKKQQEVLDLYLGVVKNYQSNKEGIGQSSAEVFTDPFAFLPFVKSKDEKMLAKTMDAAIIGMQEAWNNSIGSKLLGQQLQGMNIEDVIRISLLVESKSISPEQMLVLKDVVERNGKDINQVIKFALEITDAETLGRITTLLGRFENTTKQKGFQNLTDQLLGKDPAKLKSVLTALEEYAKAPDTIPVNMGMEIDQSDIDRLAAFGKEIDGIKKRFPNGQFDAKLLTKYQTELAGAGMPANATLDYVVSNIDYFMKLPAEKRFEAIFAFTMLKDADSVKADIEKTLKIGFMKKAEQRDPATMFVDSARTAASLQYDAWRKSAEGVKAYTTALKEMGLEWKGTGATDGSLPGTVVGTGGDAPKKDMSFLNDLAQKLKLVKEGGFNALTPLASLRKFLNDGGKNSINPGLDAQAGAIKQIESAAKKAGISIDKDFMEIIRGLDAEQFKLWSDTLFNIQKNGRITGLKDDFIVINEGFRKATIGGYIQDVKDASKEIENQVAAHKLLTKEGYNSLEIQKILQDATLTAKIAAQGGLKATKQEQQELNKEIKKTIDLNYQLSTIKLNDNIADTNMQIEAYKKLAAAGVKQEVILEILKDKSNAWAIGSADATVNVKDKFSDLIVKTKNYSDMLELIRKQSLTFEQSTQEAIDANTTVLDLQTRALQNQFDIANIGLKAKIKTAEVDVKSVNESIQKEQDKIDAINLTLKYDPNIGQNFLDDLQEKINDAQRNMDINFDRPLQVLSDRSAVLSNDLTLIDKATESINEKYDAQEKALQTISELNSDIAAQEKSRISLADALSQGDISAAAQLANDMRTTAAEAANRKSGEFIAAARKAETDNLVSASGMTKAQIEAEQFRISQQSYALEQQRKTVQTQILGLEDQVYNITELREARLLSIRDIETVIDGIKSTQLAKAQENLDKLQAELDKNQEILDAKLLAIENEKLGWESIQIQLDGYKAKLVQSNNELRTMKDIMDSIIAAMAVISSMNYSSTSAFVSSAGSVDSYVQPENTAASVAALEEFITVVEELNAAQAAADEAAANYAENSGGSGRDAAYDRRKAAEAAARLAAAQAAYDATLPAIDPNNTSAGGGAGYFAMSSGGMVPRYMASGGIAGYKPARKKIPMQMSYGGMVPKYFAVGGMSRGTDIIPAMLTPGEFVMTKYAVDSYGVDKMKAINSGSYDGEKVYNYNLNVNVKSDANPEDIARVVMTQIRQVDSQRIRAQRG